MTLAATSETDPAVQAEAAIERWLKDATGASGLRVTRFELLPGGAIQENWLLDVSIPDGPWSGDHAWVLRTNAASSVAASLSRAEEYAVLRVAHAHAVAVPQPLFLCEDTAVTGREFFVMERLNGIAVGHRLTREAALVPDGDALAGELGANLARLHSIAPPHPELERALGRPRANHATACIAEYRAYLDTLFDAYPTIEYALRWCEVHAPNDARTTLIHRDYRTGNYLVDGGRLAGVLDWEFAGWGDPREDLGWFTARCWRFAGPDREAGGIASVEPFLHGYASVAGWSASRADLDYWQVMAHLRWAIIALQQAQRHLSGGERSLELALTGRIVHELEYEMVHIIEGRSR